MLAVAKPRLDGDDAAADAIAGLDDRDRRTVSLEVTRGGKTRQPGAENDDPRALQAATHRRSIHGGNMSLGAP